MKQKLLLVIFLILVCTGIFSKCVDIFTWLFMLNYNGPEISIVGNIIVRVLTFAVSYIVVGLIFKLLGWFNGKAMSIVYFVVSTLIGFILAYAVWLVEEYYLILIIIFGSVLVVTITILIIMRTRGKKQENPDKMDE